MSLHFLRNKIFYWVARLKRIFYWVAHLSRNLYWVDCPHFSVAYLSLMSPCDEFKLWTDWWWICAWWVTVCDDLLGVLSLLACLNRLKLKKRDRTAFRRPAQISPAAICSNPPTSFCRKIFKHASTLSSCKEWK